MIANSDGAGDQLFPLRIRLYHFRTPEDEPSIDVCHLRTAERIERRRSAGTLAKLVHFAPCCKQVFFKFGVDQCIVLIEF